ncbi:Yip1 family protein [Rhodococcoides kroppenstedtii]|uniref:Yip1 family protein n=1 Tax=Rhodococcoides kroppenstedtii TaxID=293050 RepID=UPI0028E2F531|nr:Yip1 family protein [Rhodococcus kroppenstedtii]
MTDDNTGGTTGPVSVAELLARNGATVGTGGRRRRGMAGGISVAELTGEIPVIRDEAPADEDRADEDRTDENRVDEDRTEETPAVAEEHPVETETEPVAESQPEPEPVVEPEPEPVAETETRRRPTPAFVPQEEPALFSGAPSVAGDRLRDSVARPDRRAEPEPELEPEPEPQPELDLGLEQDAEPETTALTRVDGDVEAAADAGPADAETPPDEAADTPAPARSRGPVRQWLSLVGQGAVAIVLGALLFKGFERLWEMLPWVALVLAFFVIVGLVAVVRVLRRTDDIVSILLAVVVGVFVTLGPLAFMLST